MVTLNASPVIYFPLILVEKNSNSSIPKRYVTVVNISYPGPVLGCYV